MSTLAIVLGIGFLTGVLVFSNGLGSTFDGDHQGLDARRAGTARRAPSSFEAFGIGNTDARLTPADVERSRRAARGRPGRRQRRRPRHVPPRRGRQAGRRPGRAHHRLQLHRHPQPARRAVAAAGLAATGPRAPTRSCSTPAPPRRPATRSATRSTVIAPSGDSIENVRKTLTMTGTAEFNGGGTAGATLLIFSTEGAQQVFLGGRDVFTSVGAHRRARRHPAAAGRRRRGRCCRTAYEAVEGDTVAEESQDAVGRVPRRDHPRS